MQMKMSSNRFLSDPHDLPKQFVASLKVLFDILDENRCGLVPLAELESKWKGMDIEGLPKGVLRAWRRYISPDRKLDFPRFILGINDAMKDEMNAPITRKPSTQNYSDNIYERLQSRQPQSSYTQHPDLIPNQSNQRHSIAITVANQPIQRESVFGNRHSISDEKSIYSHAGGLRSNGQTSETAMTKLRTFSMPQLSSDPKHNPLSAQNRSLSPSDLSAGRQYNGSENIVESLKQWQTDRSVEETRKMPSNNKQLQPVDPRASVASMSALERYVGDSRRSHIKGEREMPADDSTIGTRRRSSRRHTVNNGVDFQMLKRLKQLEEEKDVLMQGLETLERGREWYHTQIRHLQEKQKYLGTTVQQDYSLDAHQEKIDFQSARISELNQHLLCLTQSSNKGFPIHMNLAVRPTNSPQKVAPPTDHIRKQLQDQTNLVNRLREQNKQLTAEVTQRSDRITQLEQERVKVVREMFELRQKFQDQAKISHRPRGYEESSYI